MGWVQNEIAERDKRKETKGSNNETKGIRYVTIVVSIDAFLRGFRDT